MLIAPVASASNSQCWLFKMNFLRLTYYKACFKTDIAKKERKFYILKPDEERKDWLLALFSTS